MRFQEEGVHCVPCVYLVTQKKYGEGQQLSEKKNQKDESKGKRKIRATPYISHPKKGRTSHRDGSLVGRKKRAKKQVRSRGRKISFLGHKRKGNHPSQREKGEGIFPPRGKKKKKGKAQKKKKMPADRIAQSRGKKKPNVRHPQNKEATGALERERKKRGKPTEASRERGNKDSHSPPLESRKKGNL